MHETIIEPTQLAGRAVLFVMAAEAEYGDKLKRRFTPLVTGVGPVEAGISMTANLCGLDNIGKLPELIISLGSAGSRSLEHGMVYQVSDVTYRDMDATLLGFEKGVTPFLDLPASLTFPLLVPGLPRASLSSGGDVISGFGYDAIQAEMVDMETYAVCRAAARFAIPVIALRGISDGQGELAELDDWTATLHLIDERLAEAVDTVAAALESDAIPL